MYLYQRSSSLDCSSFMAFGSELFDGLALGSRLAYLDLPHKYRNVPLLAVFFYGITTPIGIAMGLHARMVYAPGSAHMSLISGILGTLSASILLYTGFVELLAQEFLLSLRPDSHSHAIREASIWKLLYVLTCVALGYAVVAFLGKWA
jgi:solute carrier family 39 (zinc transporter), member 1/2/3